MLRQIGQYRLQAIVGRGGLGVVYRARDRSNRTVAVKILNQPAADSVAARRLVREFTELSVLKHRNVVRVLDVGVEEDAPFLAMEFVDGVPLRRFLEVASSEPCPTPSKVVPRRIEAVADEEEPSTDDQELAAGAIPSWMQAEDEADSLDPRPRRSPESSNSQVLPGSVRATVNHPERVRRLRDVISQVCDGLAYIHAHGLVHRDVKPSNVLVNEAGCPKLVDFGLVKSTLASSNTTATGHIVGTYRYMSPEQARGAKVDGRSDLYAIGGILYEMLCGHPPFAHVQAIDLVHAIVREPPIPVRRINPEADEGLASIADRLLHKNPGARFASAEEVARLLRAGGRSVAVRSPDA